ncbi:MAG: glycosyltransferase [Candidatus Dormibacteria bacterium]
MTNLHSGLSGQLVGCSIVARNYLPQVRVLAKSWEEHHGKDSFFVVIVDDLKRQVEEEDEPFLILDTDALGLSHLEYQHMAMMYDVVELSTALKPFALMSLRKRFGGVVAYIDPDIQIFAPLTYLLESGKHHPVALVPHLLEPMPTEDHSPREQDILAAGVYNLGFISTAPGSEPFLEWWGEHLRTEAIIDPKNNLFTDQRWADFAPCFTEADIIRDRGWDIAYWNLGTRQVTVRDGSWYIDNDPLTFFHFSGYSPAARHLLTTHFERSPRILLSEREELIPLTEQYREKLLQCGWSADRAQYGYARLPNGLELTRTIRRIVRDALVDPKADHPFSGVDFFTKEGADLVVTYLNEPAEDSWSDEPPSRYYIAHYKDRTDLQVAFPHALGTDAPAFRKWIHDYGQYEFPVPKLLMPDRIVTPKNYDWAPPSKLKPGIAVGGYFNAEFGVAEAGRSMLSAVEASGLRHTAVLFERTKSRKEHPYGEKELLTDCDTNIIAVNADQLSLFANHVGTDFFKGRYNIGFWFWEIEDFPGDWNPIATTFLQEIWTASNFVAEAIRKTVPLPVKVFPMPVAKPVVDPEITRSRFGIPEEAFVFMFMFDYFSVFERKNPIGTIQAYCDAFAESDGCCLVIKTVNGESHRVERELLRYHARSRKDMIILEDYLSPVEKSSLLNLADCYVSLHRSEGFGLTIAEAMLLEKPVIVTNYSGNVDFTTEENSYLVPYERVPIPMGCRPYPETSFWADPDLETACQHMQQVRSSMGNTLDNKIEKARNTFQQKYSANYASQYITDLLKKSAAYRSRQILKLPKQYMRQIVDKIPSK